MQINIIIDSFPTTDYMLCAVSIFVRDYPAEIAVQVAVQAAYRFSGKHPFADIPNEMEVPYSLQSESTRRPDFVVDRTYIILDDYYIMAN